MTRSRSAWRLTGCVLADGLCGFNQNVIRVVCVCQGVLVENGKGYRVEFLFLLLQPFSRRIKKRETEGGGEEEEEERKKESHRRTKTGGVCVSSVIFYAGEITI